MSLSVNISVDSASPLISYQPAELWRVISQANDPYASSYANDSTATGCGNDGPGGTATFTFEGTAIWVYGAKRGNHGLYTVQVDSSSPQQFNGFSPTETFQQLLFSSGTLSAGTHTIKITDVGPAPNSNQTGPWFDIDWITYQTTFDNPPSSSSQSVATSTVQANDGNIVYSPSGAWQSSSSSQGSSMRTTSSGASFTYRFSVPSSSGSGAVALFGTMDGMHGNATVYLTQEGQKSPMVTTGSDEYYNGPEVSSRMVFYSGDLDAGHDYNLTVVNPAANSSQPEFEVNMIQTWASGSQTSSITPGTKGPNAGSSGGGGSNAGAIAGGVVGGLLALAIIAAIIFVVLRKRKRVRDSFRGDTTIEGASPVMYQHSSGNLLNSTPGNHSGIHHAISADGGNSLFPASPMESAPYGGGGGPYSNGGAPTVSSVAYGNSPYQPYPAYSGAMEVQEDTSPAFSGGMLPSTVVRSGARAPTGSVTHGHQTNASVSDTSNVRRWANGVSGDAPTISDPASPPQSSSGAGRDTTQLISTNGDTTTSTDYTLRDKSQLVHPATSNASEQGRPREADAGLLLSGDDDEPEPDHILPPDYDNARQPWESRR